MAHQLRRGRRARLRHDVQAAGQEALYEPNAYRTSDHDPVLVGLDLNALPTTVDHDGGEQSTTERRTPDAALSDRQRLRGQPRGRRRGHLRRPLTGRLHRSSSSGPCFTDSEGNLVVTAQANATAGAYEVVASAGSGTATFHLTNLAGAADHIVINAGDKQSATIDTDFATQLDLTVYDANNNPVPNATVTFAGPLSGASASIVGAGPYTTDAGGNLVVTAHANLTAGGPYDFVATSGTATATFHLTNLVGAAASITINDGDDRVTTIDVTSRRSST